MRCRRLAWMLMALGALMPRCCQSADVASSSGHAEPGSSDYFVTLKGLGVSEGSLNPVFQEGNGQQGEDKYELRIDSEKATQLVITPQLDLSKYDLLQKPKLIFNGKVVDYSPLETIQLNYKLNESIGELNAYVTVEVQDPKGSIFIVGPGPKTHKYTIHVVQKPDIEDIVRAQNVSVTTNTGQVVAPDIPFDPNSDEAQLEFFVSASVTSVNVALKCPAEASGLTYDGTANSLGSTFHMDLEGAASSTLMQCVYQHQQWTKGQAMQRTYIAKVSRTADLSKTKLDLVVWPPEVGVCAEVNHNASSLQCAVSKQEFGIIASWNNALAEVSLKDATKLHVPGRSMQNGLPTQMRLGEDISTHYVVVLQAGKNKKFFNLTFPPQESCTGMTCPAGKEQRDAATLLTCKSDKCNPKDPEDIAKCCEIIEEPCSTYIKKFGCKEKAHPPRQCVDKMECAGQFCKDNEVDKERCCEYPTKDASIEWACPNFDRMSWLTKSINDAKQSIKDAEAAKGKKPAEQPTKSTSDLRKGYNDLKTASVPLKTFLETHVPAEAAQSMGSVNKALDDIDKKIGVLEKGGSKDQAKDVQDQELKAALLIIAEAGRVVDANEKKVRDMQLDMALHNKTKEKLHQVAEMQNSTQAMNLHIEQLSRVFLAYGERLTALKKRLDYLMYLMGLVRSKQASCVSFNCGPGYIKVEKPEHVMCQGTQCTRKVDQHTCCKHVAVCSMYDCPWGTTLKPNADLYPCKADVCDYRDTITCCDQAAFCDSFTCPKNWVRKANASQLPCAGTSCVTQDTPTCCSLEGTCSTYSCPTGMTLKSNADSIQCAGKGANPNSCNNLEPSWCCNQNPTCSTYTCGPGFAPDADQAQTQCSSSTCSDKDRKRCCTLVNPFHAAKQASLEILAGSGKCDIDYGPSSFRCDATGTKLTVAAKYMFDASLADFTGVTIGGTWVKPSKTKGFVEASVPVPPLSVPEEGKDPKYYMFQLRSFVGGDLVTGSIHIWVSHPSKLVARQLLEDDRPLLEGQSRAPWADEEVAMKVAQFISI